MAGTDRFARPDARGNEWAVYRRHDRFAAAKRSGHGFDCADWRRLYLEVCGCSHFCRPTSLTYTLSNADGTSPPATVTINVTAQPDPSRDPEVIGLIRAQVEAAKHFADIQIQGYGQRLEQLHNEGDQRHNSMSLSVAVRQSSDNPDAYAQQQSAANDPALAAIATASPQSTYGAPNPERMQPNAYAKQGNTSTGASPIRTGSLQLARTRIPRHRRCRPITRLANWPSGAAATSISAPMTMEPSSSTIHWSA